MLILCLFGSFCNAEALGRSMPGSYACIPLVLNQAKVTLPGFRSGESSLRLEPGLV